MNENFTTNDQQRYECDFLVIGTGIAGLSFAIRASEYGKVFIITKKSDIESNTNHAQGGIASVINSEDSIDSHIEDTLVAGAGICNREAVSFLAEKGPSQIDQLMAWGADFSKNEQGQLELGREGGHSQNRIVHQKDFTGKEVERALLHKAKSISNITIFEKHFSVDLITQHQAQIVHGHKMITDKIVCFGAYVLDVESMVVKIFRAAITMLATGGAGKVYLHSTNPDIATGDGIGMAYRAGAKLGNMEFFQFHPTTIYHPAGESFLISEAVRGYGAKLRNAEGQEFLRGYHPLEALAPRDIVARAIDNELKKSGQPCVFLDVTQKDADTTIHHFPLIYAKCLELGINMTKDMIPVVPAAHYMCGGVKVDLHSRSSIRHLYACGETAYTGVHGANRLASNSLLEALVFSQSAIQPAIAELQQLKNQPYDIIVPQWDQQNSIGSEESILIEHNREEIYRLMWNYVGIVRTNTRLARANSRLKNLKQEIKESYNRSTIYPSLLELRNFYVTAKLVVKSARFRRESRGLHYNMDYPNTNDNWIGSTTIVRGEKPFLEPC